MKIKNAPADSFAPRGKEAIFIGTAEDVTHGVLVTNWEGKDWGIQVATSYVQRGAAEKGAAGQEEPKEHYCEHLADDIYEGIGFTDAEE